MYSLLGIASSSNPIERNVDNNVVVEIWEVFVKNNTLKFGCCVFWSVSSRRQASMAPGMASLPMWSVPDMSMSAALIIRRLSLGGGEFITMCANYLLGGVSTEGE